MEIYIAPSTLETGSSSTPPPIPVTPELTLSHSALTLKAGQSAVIQIGTKSPGSIYLEAGSNKADVISGKWGSWNSTGTQRPITITGKYAGMCSLTINMHDSATGQSLTRKTIPVTVEPSGTPAVSFSPASVTVESGSSAVINMTAVLNGAKQISIQGFNKNICVIGKDDIRKTSSSTASITVHGNNPGTTAVRAVMKDASGGELGSFSFSVTVKAREPDLIRPEKTSVELYAGEQLVVPVQFRFSSKAIYESAQIIFDAKDSNICLTKMGDGAVNRFDLIIYGRNPGKTTIPLALLGNPDKTLLASSSIDVTVKERQTAPPSVRLSQSSVSMRQGETASVDVSWNGTIPAGCTLDADSIAGNGCTADAVALSLRSAGNSSARLNLTGVKSGKSLVEVSIKDASGRTLAKAQTVVTVVPQSQPAKIIPDMYTSGMLSLSVGESRQISFSYSGDFTELDYSCSAGLSVRELSRANGRLVLQVTANQAGVQGVSARLLDEQGNVLDEAGYGFEVAKIFGGGAELVNPNQSDPPVKDPGTTNGTSVVTRPEDGGTVQPSPSESPTQTVVIGTIQVRNAAGPTHASIPIVSTPVAAQSAGSVTLPPAGFTASGFMEVPSDETSAGRTAGTGDRGDPSPIDLGPTGGDAAQNDLLGSDAAGALRFTDVDAGKYYYDAVLWAASAGVTDGISGTTLDPGAPCPRGQVVEFLWRAQGCPQPSITKNPFTDLSPDDSCYQAALWAYSSGVTSGSTASTFSPGSTCTRGQVVTFLWRANGKPSVSGGGLFSDVPSSAYYAGSVRWAVDKGITKGTTETTFSPNATCSRGQILTFLYRGMV